MTDERRQRAVRALAETFPLLTEEGWSRALDAIDANPAARADLAAWLTPQGFAAQVADNIYRAYANGHRDGLECGRESAGFGVSECAHVGSARLAATQPDAVEEPERPPVDAPSVRTSKGTTACPECGNDILHAPNCSRA